MIAGFLQEIAKWLKMGRPNRTNTEVEQLYKYCSQCEFYKHQKNQVGNCSVCGCYVRGHKEKGINKLRFATTSCPKEKWQSVYHELPIAKLYEEVAEYEIRDMEKDCGCGG